MIIVSACLAGVHCRYDGGSNPNDKILQLVKAGRAILVCPEQLGGLTTPRDPAEIIENDKTSRKVMTKSGKDVTKQFILGAEEALNIAKLSNCTLAILKARSPSCGYNEIYDGTFSGHKKKGKGLTAEIFSSNNIKVYTEENLPPEFSENL